jgi:hypothetical protein
LSEEYEFVHAGRRDISVPINKTKTIHLQTTSGKELNSIYKYILQKFSLATFPEELSDTGTPNEEGKEIV